MRSLESNDEAPNHYTEYVMDRPTNDEYLITNLMNAANFNGKTFAPCGIRRVITK
jgi:hypothetical protein